MSNKQIPNNTVLSRRAAIQAGAGALAAGTYVAWNSDAEAQRRGRRLGNDKDNKGKGMGKGKETETVETAKVKLPLDTNRSPSRCLSRQSSSRLPS